MHDLERTIVAVATPPGRGGIGCLRLSGPQAVTIAAQLFRAGRGAASDSGATPLAEESLADLPALRPKFGSFVDRGGQLVDHGYLVRFAGKAAFTGESSVELWPHGSPPVLRALLDAALALGAEAAEPGEFTYRALRNGRIDLTRAEAVRDLVDARTLYQAKLAYAQAEGRVAEEVEPLRLQMEEWIARGEAAVEFVDESETHLTRTQLGEAVVTATARCAELLDGFKTGRMVRSGATLVLTGRPNVGKSSLFNALLQRHRAIVTEVAGTTRDTLEEELDLDGIPLRLVDTAGLRDVHDPVESEGVRRAHQAREEADLELWVFDAARPLDRGELEAVEVAAGEGELSVRRIVVWNKRDLERVATPLPEAELSAAGRDWFSGAIEVSAKTGEGLDALRTALRERLVGSGPLEDPVITDGRHAAALERTREALARAAAAYRDGLSEELVLEDLRMAMDHLGSITGQFTTEDLYDKVFSTFCIGK